MWEEQWIYNLIHISRVGPRYNPIMLLAVMCLWKISTNTFQFPCGMVTPTHFDLAVIAGLWPNGEDYEPSAKTDFKFSNHVYNTFIGENWGFVMFSTPVNI